MTKTAIAAAALALLACTPDAPPTATDAGSAIDARADGAGAITGNCELAERTTTSGTTVVHYGVLVTYFNAPNDPTLVVAKFCDRYTAGNGTGSDPALEPAACEVRTTGYEVMADGRGRLYCGFRTWETNASGTTISENASYWRSVTIEVR